MEPLERRKQLVRILHIEAYAIIAHEDDSLVLAAIFSNLNHGVFPWRCKLYSIGEQVPENLGHQAAVAFNSGKLRYFKIYFAAAKLPLQTGNHFFGHFGEVGLLQL